jgi:hypothetical protein
MNELNTALRNLTFKWLPKHLNHITENIVFKKRNVSFLAINALFRSKTAQIVKGESPFEGSFVISDFVALQTNDLLGTLPEELFG